MKVENRRTFAHQGFVNQFITHCILQVCVKNADFRLNPKGLPTSSIRGIAPLPVEVQEINKTLIK